MRERLDKAEQALPPGIQHEQQQSTTVGGFPTQAQPETPTPAAPTVPGFASTTADGFDISSNTDPASPPTLRDPWQMGARSSNVDHGKKHHIPRIELHKVDLSTIADDKKFIPWRATFDMEDDDIRSGIDKALKEIRAMKTPCATLKFVQLMASHAVRPDNYEPIEWTYKHIAKQMYRILFKRTDGDLNKIVLGCEKDRDGIEAYRLLSKHCDPYTFNTAGALMEARTELGNKKAGSVYESLSFMREMKKKGCPHMKSA